MGVRLVKYNLGNLVGSGGTYDHNDLLNRDLPDQHPISSITGLQEILDNLNTVDNVVDTYTVDLNYDTTTNTLKADVRIFDDGSDTNAIQSLATGLYVPKVITEDSNTITWEHVSLGETIEEIFQNGIVFSHASSSWNNIANSTEANAWYWDSSLESIVQPINTVTFTGYVSQDVYDYYTHTVTLKSSNSDNDDDGVVIAYMVDDAGRPHTLSAICCRQGTGIRNWALVYDYMLPDQQTLAQGGSGGIANPGNSGSSGWNVYSAGITVQVTKFQNIVTCTCSNWGSTTLNENTKITIDLDNYSWGSLFRGDVHYGYCNHSQSYSYFKDIVFISDNCADATKLIAWVKISEKDGNNLYELEDGLYVPKTETHTHDNKSTLDLFGQDTDGTLLFDGAKIKGGSDISKEPDNAIKELTDGLYVEDLSDEVEMLEKNLKIFTQYQRFVNTELEFAYFRLPAQSGLALNACYNISHILSNEIEYTTNSFKLKAGKTYQINVGMTADGSSQQASMYALYDITSDCTVGTWGQLISSVWDSKWNDVPISCIYSPAQDCEIVLREKGNYTPAISSGFITVIETGRAIVVDPVEYVNEETGIEDTPVGHIISFMGMTPPKHYLLCDGAEYNIVDYPILAGFIYTQFGVYNYFGGDGIDTFAVPNLIGEYLRGLDPNNPIPNPDYELYTTLMASTPTATKDVLFCIKYEPTYFMNVTNQVVGRKTAVLWEKTDKTYICNPETNHNDVLNLSHSITDYSEICIYYKATSSTLGKETDLCCKIINPDLYTLGEEFGLVVDNGQDEHIGLRCYFSTDTVFCIQKGYECAGSGTSLDTIKLLSVQGVKYAETDQTELDDHIAATVTTVDGIHGLRYYGSKLQYYNPSDTSWKDITTGSSGGSGGSGTFSISSYANNAIKKYSDGYYVEAHKVSPRSNNRLVKYSDGYYVEDFIISSNANNALVKLSNGFYAPAFLISAKANNALVKYLDGYYVPALPVNNATTDDIDDAKDEINTIINNLQANVNNKYTTITNEIAKIASNTTKSNTHYYTGNNSVLDLVIDVTTLYNSSNVILNFEILIQNTSTYEELELLIEENTIQTMNCLLEPEEIQRYKLTNIPEFKIYTKGNYKMYLYVNYI